MRLTIFLFAAFLIPWVCQPVHAQSFLSGQDDGTITLGMKPVAAAPGAQSEPSVSISLGPLPSDWTTCQQDSDCAIAYFGPEPIGVNVAHKEALSNLLAQVGMASTGHAPGTYFGNTTPFCNRITDAERERAQQSLKLQMSPGVQGTQISGAKILPAGCLAMPPKPANR